MLCEEQRMSNLKDREIIEVKKRCEQIQLHADQVRMAQHLDGRRALWQTQQNRHVLR